MYYVCIFYLLGKLKACATKSVLVNSPGNARDSPGGGGKEKGSNHATRMTAAASMCTSFVCIYYVYSFLNLLGKLKACTTMSVLDNSPGSARDSPGGGGKEKESYRATRMTAAASMYTSSVFYNIIIMGTYYFAIQGLCYNNTTG